jgi:hypothetical protein
MKRPTAGSQKKVTVENLVGLGAERLAEILVGVAETRADLKRRLRMELAAEQGPGPLTAEIDKRLNAFETSRGQITWRQRPAFIRDLDALRDLNVARLAPLDRPAAVERLWRFMDSARQSERRYRERNGELDGVYERAAGDLGALLAEGPIGPAAADLIDSLTKNPTSWKAWLPGLLAHTSPAFAAEALRGMSELRGAVPGWITLIRQLADAAGDVNAYGATYTADALRTPSVAAEVAQRLLAAGRIEEAGDVLRAAAPAPGPKRKPQIDVGWETAWIDYLEQAGREDEAQAVRWSAFERTLSADRARTYIARLADFEDVEAENRAFSTAAGFADFQAGLRFLMEWPSLVEAARMIEQRSDEVDVAPDAAELWAAKLRRRHPKAAHLLLRKAATAAFRRRDFSTCDRLTQEAETIAL